MRLRSLLFAPGDSTHKMRKALDGDADAVILDLEDSVVPASKGAARAVVASMLPGISRAGVVVRVNPRSTPWYLADLAAIVPGRPAAVMLPKCGGPEDLRRLDHHLEALETVAGLPVGAIGVLVLATESAAATRRQDYAGVTLRLLGLCFGAEDLAADLGVPPRGIEGRYSGPVAHARDALLIAAAAAGVPAIDTPFPDPRDRAGLEREAAQAAADGFAGKLCIHPAQIGVVAAAFTPDATRLRWAEAVRDAFAANPGAGVLSLHGKMLERSHLRLAERLLAARP